MATETETEAEEGTSIEDLADDGAAEEEQEEFVVGTSGQLGLAVGGKSPDTSKVSIGSAGREVEGQFKKGDVVTFLVETRIDGIKFDDRHDSQGIVIGCTRTHVAKPLTVRVVDSPNDED